MKKLLNTLYVTTPDTYLSLDGENIVVLRDAETLLRVPLLNLEAVVTFGYTGASPALMGACAERGIALTFMTASGHFLADVAGDRQGNVLLRRTQYRVADDESASVKIARNMIAAKLHNSRWVIERAVRDHELRIDAARVQAAARAIANAIPPAREAESPGVLRGVEGEAAQRYFSVFDEMILQNKSDFYFKSRSRRPPMDNLNALLSFAYSLLANDCAAALCGVGLDPYVGFLHRDRPGRKSLALDLTEELRAVFADRFVLTLVNNRKIDASAFKTQESGAVLLKDEARREFLAAWQARKRETITHPYLSEKIEWGLVPHAQSLLLARHLRGDLDEYPPFLWK
ncbi:MAG: type I-C CRISPR-associated endonuclease Cas1c [Oscillospiraceae bacterium]|nr:type I-C CRISPR-associated endonuclease Cas1c [Oscillospiraceae bacterium]